MLIKRGQVKSQSPLFQLLTIVVWLCNDGELSFFKVNVFYLALKPQNIYAPLYYEGNSLEQYSCLQSFYHC